MRQARQFSLKTLLLFVTGVAVLICLTFAVPVEAALPVLAIGIHVAASFAAILVCFGTRALRAFAIGTGVPLVVTMLGGAQYMPFVIDWSRLSIAHDDALTSLVLGDTREMAEGVRAYLGVSMLIGLALGPICVCLQVFVAERGTAGALGTEATAEGEPHR